jgi:predicted nicotinamide N-methyase
VGNAVACTTRLAGFLSACVVLDIGGTPIRLQAVPDLADLVDRGAVLRGEAEPPYWAYLWAGARGLATYAARRLALRGTRVLELGCGLGLPGVVAARAGARVLFVDAMPAALAFVEASLAANGLRGEVACADYRALPAARCFDVVLAAEVAYDRAGYAGLAAAFRRHLAPGGIGVMADGYRTDTRPLYAELARAGLATAAVDCRVPEEGRMVPLRLVMIRRASPRRR